MMSRQQISEELQRTEDFEDVWEDFMECIEDHLEEVEMKWDHYDDEVWAKAIIFERNRRVAKVLFRKPVVVIDNNHEGYNDDGIIGLRGFSTISTQCFFSSFFLLYPNTTFPIGSEPPIRS